MCTFVKGNKKWFAALIFNKPRQLKGFDVSPLYSNARRSTESRLNFVFRPFIMASASALGLYQWKFVKTLAFNSVLWVLYKFSRQEMINYYQVHQKSRIIGISDLC